MEDTLVLIKPDGVRRKMAGQIITALESQGFTIKSLYQKHLKTSEATELYKEHQGKWHFPRNIKHITSGPSIVIHIQGEDVVEKCRTLVERIREANEDVIKLPRNLVHATSDVKKAQQELIAVGCIQPT